MDERFGAEQGLVIGMSEAAGESSIRWLANFRCPANIQGPASAIAEAPSEAIA